MVERRSLDDTRAIPTADALGERAGTVRPDAGDEIRVPVHEERLEVEKRQVQQGEVRLHKTVEEERRSVPVEVMREHIHVEERTVDERPLAEADAAATAFQEGTIRIPVRGEEVVVNKRPVVTAEVVVTKERSMVQREVTGTVRREHVDVDEDYEQHRPFFQDHFAARSAPDRTFAEAERNYRTGWRWGRDKMWTGRRFEDVEPQLRREWESDTTESSTRGGWDDLRDEVRAGWERARSA